MSKRRNETSAEYEMRLLREQAEHRDDRRNEVVTRGELLDALAWARNRMGCNATVHDLISILEAELS